MDNYELCRGALRPIEREDLQQILAWRNHPNVREFMYSQRVISSKEHARWYDQVTNDPSKHVMIFEYEKTPVGVVNFTESDAGRNVEWGFYLDPNSRGKKLGAILAESALSFAFEECEFHKVCGAALAFNKRSIHFHQKHGFEHEGTFRDHHFDGERYHDVVFFGILARDWFNGKSESGK